MASIFLLEELRWVGLKFVILLEMVGSDCVLFDSGATFALLRISGYYSCDRALFGWLGLIVILIKGCCFWTLKAPSDCSWCWRKILQLRELVRPFIKCKVGSCSTASFKYDDWLPVGPLYSFWTRGLQWFPSIPVTAWVSQVLRSDGWHWPWSNDLQASLISTLVATLSVRDNDSVVWSISRSGHFTSRSAWEQIRDSSTRLVWTKRIWFSRHIPCASFICWLIWLDWLSTRDRLLHWNVSLSSGLCEFCSAHMEFRDHLFFSCCFTGWIWQLVLAKLGHSRLSTDWTIEFAWFLA